MCRFRKTSVAVWLAVFQVSAYGQNHPPAPEMVTDRSDITESPVVVPKGSAQFENGITWTDDHGEKTLGLPEGLLRLGIFERTELRIDVPNYLNGLNGLTAQYGFGDAGVGVKQQLGPLRGGVDLSVIAGLSLPTGAERASSHGFDPYVKLPWSKDFENGWSMGSMQSLFWYTENGRRNLTWEPTFFVAKEITKPWEVFAEYGGDFAQRGESQQIAHFGTAYLINPKHQIDFHFGFGLSHGAPSRFFAGGYSFRVDGLWGRR
jgi:hypothetical protein